KEISPNESDKQGAKDLAAGKIVVPQRARRTSKASRSQRSRSIAAGVQTGVPTVAAIFDAVSSLSYTHPYNVKVAMYGLDAMVLAVPRDPAISPRMTGWKRAGKITMSDKHTTSVSAVAIIREFPASEGGVPALLVYHNHFARVPIDPDRLK